MHLKDILIEDVKASNNYALLQSCYVKLHQVIVKIEVLFCMSNIVLTPQWMCCVVPRYKMNNFNDLQLHVLALPKYDATKVVIHL